MTIQSETRIAGPFVGDDAIVNLDFDFVVFEADDLRVFTRNSSGTETTLTLTTQYSVALNADQDADPGGRVTLVTALATGLDAYVESNVDYLQSKVFTNTGNFYPTVLNTALDKIHALLLQLKLSVSRALLVPSGETAPTVLTLSGANENKVLGFNSVGNVLPVDKPVDGEPGGVGISVQNTTDGLAQTSGSGASNRYFSVPGTGNVALTIYRNDSGVATQVNQVPSYSAVQNLTRGKIYANGDHDFGKSGFTAAQNRAALQAAVDAANAKFLANEGIWEVVIEEGLGTVEIDGPILCFEHDTGGTNQFDLISMVISSAGGYETQYATVIKLTDGNECCFIFQAVRSTYIHGLYLEGVISANPTHAQVVNGGWTSAASDTQFTSHQGIAIDPCANDANTSNHYTKLGADYYNQDIGSNSVYIVDVTFVGFAVGCGIALSNGSPNCDGVVLVRPRFFRCKTLVAVGQDQTRACAIYDMFVNHFQTGVDCVNYGVGIGALPKIFGGQMTIGKEVFIADGARDSGYINALYLEGVWRVGKWSGQGFPLVLDGVHGKLMEPSTYSVPGPDHHLEISGAFEWHGGSLYYNNNTIDDFSILATNARIVFRGVGLDGWIHGAIRTSDSSVIHYDKCVNRNASGGSYLGVSDDYGIARQSSITFLQAFAHKGSRYAERDLTLGNDFREWISHGSPIITLDTNVSVTVGSDGTATFTSADAAKYIVGEYVQSTTGWTSETYTRTTGTAVPASEYLSIGRVKSIVGSVVTLEHVPKGMTTKPYDIVLARPAYWRARLMGTTTSASNTITMSAAGLQVRDRIRGTGIPDGTHVTAVSGTTVTMSHNATASGTVEVRTANTYLGPNSYRSAALGAPTSETWFKGDFLKAFNISAAQPDGNDMLTDGYRCTVSGTSPTFVTQYISTVTPAT